LDVKSSCPSFISEACVQKHTETLISAIDRAKAKIKKNPFRNVVDPFSAIVDGMSQGIDAATWMEQEIVRQLQKSLQNAIGDFHQSVFGSLKGWESPGPGGSFDVENKERNLIAEIKSKYNTMNSRSALATYDTLSRHLDYREQQSCTAYLVEIIPRASKRYLVPFTATERGVRRPERSDLLKIDGASFFDVATGEKDSMLRFFEYWSELLASSYGVEEKLELDGYSTLFNKVFG